MLDLVQTLSSNIWSDKSMSSRLAGSLNMTLEIAVVA